MIGFHPYFDIPLSGQPHSASLHLVGGANSVPFSFELIKLKEMVFGRNELCKGLGSVN